MENLLQISQIIHLWEIVFCVVRLIYKSHHAKISRLTLTESQGKTRAVLPDCLAPVKFFLHWNKCKRFMIAYILRNEPPQKKISAKEMLLIDYSSGNVQLASPMA